MISINQAGIYRMNTYVIDPFLTIEELSIFFTLKRGLGGAREGESEIK